MIDREEIRHAVEVELGAAPRYYDLSVIDTAKVGPVWQVHVDLSDAKRISTLDESWEGAAAWWPTPNHGTAEVLSVDPDRALVNLRFVNSPLPEEGQQLRIYPPRYLEALLDIWSDSAWAPTCAEWLGTLPNQTQPFRAPMIDRPPTFHWLRERQSQAYRLFNHRAAFLWGPPGTGKTTTIGALLASYTHRFPQHTILLLSSTNVAVDQALIATDGALQQLYGKRLGKRGVLTRAGSNYNARMYADRPHLIPAQDEDLLKQLAALETQRPDPNELTAYATWKSKMDRTRAQLRVQIVDVIHNSRLSAMTATLAAFFHSDLRALRRFDLMVFDEASQVSIAQAAALAPLAHCCLFTGDPRQLAPIVQSSHRDARKWMGRSVFEFMQPESPNTCMLTEQSRMTHSICQLVADTFYEGRLEVARECQGDSKWAKRRQLPKTPYLEDDPLHLEDVAETGQWSSSYRGPIRMASAVFVADAVQSLLPKMIPEDIVVLTPFRAQRALIRRELRSRKISKVEVLTVHRAQGSERHTVIFDPAQGSSEFLKTEDAKRLVNVAMSRAMARLVVVLSPDDCTNPLFGHIAAMIQRHQDPDYRGIPIREYINRPDFPKCLIGQTADLGARSVCFNHLEESGRYIHGTDLKTGRPGVYSIENLLGI